MNYPNWFSSQTKNFERFLRPFSGLDNLYFLQIGAYTGDASKWILDNILTSNSSFLFDIDTWQGSDENIHKEFNWQDVELVYDNKMLPYKNVVKYKTTSSMFLKNCIDSFDFIYIDGDHTADAVYKDAILSFPLLKQGGIMAFDDYLWHHDTNNPELEPKLGIDRFLYEHYEDIQILHNEYQVWIKKFNK